eukprot:scaffold8684_cov112-Isochrysis_galbana.AAC.1
MYCVAQRPTTTNNKILLSLAVVNNERYMAPRQLITPPMEDDTNPEPGSKRVRPSSADKSSTQVRLRTRASAYGTPWPAHQPFPTEQGPRQTQQQT